MLRRSHKKSRDGCRECKRRHVKCDEARPSCRLCVLSERTCTYATPAPSNASAANVPSIDHGSACRTASHSASGSPARQQVLASVPSCVSRLIRPDLPGDLTPSSPRDCAPDAPATGDVNLDHAELLIHCFTEPDVFVLADKVDDHRFSMGMAFDIAHQYPYLLHELLAFSACHLGTRNPDTRRYHRLAFDLQTRAVAQYNASGQDITPENCVAVLLFAVVIGQHLFADALRPRDFAGLGAFVQRFTYCLCVQKGIATIYQAAAPVLMASPIERALTSGIEAQRRRPVGTDCAELMAMIRESPRVTREEREACAHAAVIIQLGLDDVVARPDEPTHMCFKWVVGVRPPLRRLLEQMHPDAMVVMAYYAMLLHLNRRAWPIGSAGAYMMGMITEHLGRDCAWLEYPRRRMAESGCM